MTTRTLTINYGDKKEYMAGLWLVKDTSMTYKESGDNECQISFTSEAEFEDLMDRIASYFALVKMQGVASDRFAEIFTQEHEEIAKLILMEYKHNWAVHFTRLIRMHIAEYFYLNDRMNLESFLLFNLRGLDAEAKLCFDDELQDYYDMEMREQQRQQGGEDELFQMLRSSLLQHGPIEQYDSIDLSYEKGSHHLFLTKGGSRVRVDRGWVDDQFDQVDLRITNEEGEEHNDPLVFLPIMIQVFGIHKLGIHGLLPAESRMLMNNLLDDWDVTDFIIVDCKGCPICPND